MPLITDNLLIEQNADLHNIRHGKQDVTVSASTLTLSAASPAITDLKGSVAGQIINMGDATQYKAGQAFTIFNQSTAIVTVKDFSGATLFTLGLNQVAFMFANDISTQTGTWDVITSSLNILFGIRSFQASYTANAGAGRFLEVYPSNPSDAAPYVIVGDSTLIALSLVSSSASTGTVSIFKNGNFVTPIATIALAAQSSMTVSGLNVSLVNGDTISIQVTAGSMSKPGVSLFLS